MRGAPLPSVPAGRFTSEPKWVDLRAYRDGANPGDARIDRSRRRLRRRDPGMPKEDLLSQEVRQQSSALTLAWSAAASLFVLAGVAGWQWYEASVQRREAIAQRNRAEQMLAAATETAHGLVFELAQRFRHAVGVPAALVKDILYRARALQEQLARRRPDDARIRANSGSMLARARTHKSRSFDNRSPMSA